ncbi:MAG: type II secretion system protein GspE, partial [Acidobacteria bacterium]|nr:type II secretion system protein GspE [Acidobacteriota bacterium]
MAQKRLGDLLLEAGLINGEQLQSAITHQKIAKGRIGSNLVALGYITEDTLMDFLGQQLGVAKVDVRHVDVPEDILRKIPKRMAE